MIKFLFPGIQDNKKLSTVLLVLRMQLLLVFNRRPKSMSICVINVANALQVVYLPTT